MKIVYKLSLGALIIVTAVIILGFILLDQIEKTNQPLIQDIPGSIEELNNAVNLDNLAHEIIYYDEVLTQAARNYVFTEDENWKNIYLQAGQKLDSIIRLAVENGDELDSQIFKGVDDANQLLVEMELEAIALVDSGNTDEAIAILESTKYSDQKNFYKLGIDRFFLMKKQGYGSSFSSAQKAIINAVNRAKDINRRSAYFTFIFILAIIIVAIIVIFPLSRSVSELLAKFQEMASHIASGDFSFRIKTDSKDEIGRIASLMNAISESLQSKTTSIESLNREIQQRKAVELDRVRVKEELSERAKELSCLYGISDVVEEYGNSINDIYQKAVNIIPQGMKKSYSACARITINGKAYQTGNFKETTWTLSRDIQVFKQKAGSIEVFYLEDFSGSGQSNFLKEEQALLAAIAEMLGRITERKSHEAALNKSEAK
ncbi:MAG: HAMP domain-containing protein, partial [Candidatus Omnitrophica bacterium]|nr:HAMP domain-containing protein [Candidatus Omnitrophota bacterium]